MKLLLAFAAGAAIASLCFVLVDRSAVSTSSEYFEATTPISSSVTDPVRDISPARRTSTSADQSSEADTDGVGFPDELTHFAMSTNRFGMIELSTELRDLMRGWSDEELVAMAERAQSVTRSQEVLNAQRVLELLSSELQRRRELAEWANSPPEEPIYLPPEFNQLMEDSLVLRHHEELQREPVDQAWSKPTESSFQNFFDSRPEIIDTYGTPTITCRTSGCEVALLAYGVDTATIAREHQLPDSAPAEVVYEDFSAAISGWSDQPWTRDFSMVLPPFIRVENGATTIYWLMKRK